MYLNNPSIIIGISVALLVICHRPLREQGSKWNIMTYEGLSKKSKGI
jgi:hypothetical protein